jgi:hypothetical protein
VSDFIDGADLIGDDIPRVLASHLVIARLAQTPSQYRVAK